MTNEVRCYEIFRDWLIARGFFDYGADEVITRFREDRPDRYDCDLFDRFMRDNDCKHLYHDK